MICLFDRQPTKLIDYATPGPAWLFPSYASLSPRDVDIDGDDGLGVSTFTNSIEVQ